MSQVDELINSLAESDSDHVHAVTDSDSYFIIDPYTREIENTARMKNVLMQFDHDSERFTFELTRYVEGHDMSLCNVVKVHYNNIDGKTGTENADLADLYDLRVDPENEDKVICSWLISRQATQLAGSLSFLLQYLCVDDEGNETYEWHTDIYDDIEIKEGRNNGPASVIPYTDILEQWRARLFNESNSGNTGGGTSGGTNYAIDNETLTIDEDGKLRVNTTDKVEADNTLPVTSAAVHAQLGNVEALLNTI